MPKDSSIKSVLIIGSGPIVIGQACEFDYAGSQNGRARNEVKTGIKSNRRSVRSNSRQIPNLLLTSGLSSNEKVASVIPAKIPKYESAPINPKDHEAAIADIANPTPTAIPIVRGPRFPLFEVNVLAKTVPGINPARTNKRVKPRVNPSKVNKLPPGLKQRMH